MSWQRVSKHNPCGVCSKDSWCMVGDSDWLCMRVSSDRTMTLKDGSTGYLHRINGDIPRTVVQHKEESKPEIDAEAIMEEWRKTTKGDWIGRYAHELGVSASSLMEMRIAWDSKHRAWAWPMRSGNGKVVGIRLRYEDGGKRSVTGSKNGLFMPYTTPQSDCLVVEGGTGCAAGLTLGFYTIGRPSCSGGLFDLKAALQRLSVRRVIIIGDNEPDKEINGRKWNPGLDGAQTLQRNLCLPCCTIMLPCKDLRDFIRAGGDSKDLERLLKSAIWHSQ